MGGGNNTPSSPDPLRVLVNPAPLAVSTAGARCRDRHSPPDLTVGWPRMRLAHRTRSAPAMRRRDRRGRCRQGDAADLLRGKTGWLPALGPAGAPRERPALVSPWRGVVAVCGCEKGKHEGEMEIGLKVIRDKRRKWVDEKCTNMLFSRDEGRYEVQSRG